MNENEVLQHGSCCPGRSAHRQQGRAQRAGLGTGIQSADACLGKAVHPANDAWGHKLISPFGVVLGCQEPELFLTLFLTGQQTQQEAVAFHAAAMIKKVDMDKAQKAGDSLICPVVVVDGSDPELMIHALWHISLQKGAPLPDCGIYYAALGRAVASQEEQRAILSNPAGYALCVVRLSPEVEKDDCI